MLIWSVTLKILDVSNPTFSLLSVRCWVGWSITARRCARRPRRNDLSPNAFGASMSAIIDTPAILGGNPVRISDYPSWPVWDEGERSRLLQVLEAGGWWQGDGSAASTFATNFAEYHGARFGMALTNGTHTLEAALVACDIGDGDEASPRGCASTHQPSTTQR